MTFTFLQKISFKICQITGDKLAQMNTDAELREKEGEREQLKKNPYLSTYWTFKVELA